ncbi:MAG: efflux RND transporter permease subunit [Rikenellaceae bacterium]
MFIKRFIDRPILSFVISVFLLLLGVIGYQMLAVEQFPEIAPPTISVSASYAGASASTVQKSVVVPLEEAINGVEDMLYMTSSASSTGSASITVYFKQGSDPDMAMVNVQNCVASAESLLPSEVTQSGVTVRKSQSSTLKMIAVYSPENTFDDIFIANYMKINIEPRISRVPGVGEVNVMGPEYALRIWLDPQKMSQYGLIPSDITAVLSQQNIESSTGTLGLNSDNALQVELSYKGRLEENTDFENLVIQSLENGEVLYLKDVATIELGAKDYNILGNVNGKSGRSSMIAQTSGSNANEIIIAVDKLIDEIRQDLPKGLEIIDLMDTKDFLDASFKNVFLTLVEAILLVILIVYIFLQSFKSTIIPSIAIIVSLVGTFAFIYLMGFSLNLLTLFALVLVIGTVVDDAIVVVEAVQSKFDGGEKSPYLAAYGAMKEVASALITTTVVFMAVFIPVCFMSGTTGTFYTQFGLTMAVAVAISTLNAMTLSPALCALIMTPHNKGENGEKLSFSSRFHIAFETSFKKLVNKYSRFVKFFVRRKWLAIFFVLLACGGLYYMMNNTKTALVPNEDMGIIFLNVQTAPGYTRNETGKIVQEIENRINTIDEIQHYSKVVGVNRMGTSGGNAGMIVIRLKDWSLRTEEGQDVESIINRIYAMTSDLTAATIMAMAPPMVTGYGTSNGFEVHVQDQKGGTIADLEQHTTDFIDGLLQRDEIVRAQTSFATNFPQYQIEVDAAQCLRNGVSPSDVLNTISGYVGSSYASNLNKYSKLYRVIFQAPAEDRLDLSSLEKMFVRNSVGEMSPVTQYLKIEKTYAAQTLSRFNLFPSISVNGMPADGYSSGQAIQAVREVAEETLPVGYGYEFGSMSREEADSSTGSTAIIFAICIIFVYLILCALYESIFMPFAVILSVPFGLLGSYLFAHLFNLTSDIYMQIGLIMLIGLLAKTAILLTEYASERRRQGMTIVEAAIAAAKARLRPILMTSLTLIFGMLPLMFATGVGANGNISLGVGVIGGMLVGTVALVFIVPSLFVIFQRIQEKVMPQRVLPKIEDEK